MAHFAVADARGLEDAGAFAEDVFPLPFIFKDDPAFEDVDHLKIEVVGVPRGGAFHPRHGADDMGGVFALRRLVDAEMTVFEERAKASALERRGVGVGDGEGLVFVEGGHLSSSKPPGGMWRQSGRLTGNDLLGPM